MFTGHASADLLNGKGASALYLASREGTTGVAAALLKAGAHKDVIYEKDGQTPVIASVANENLDITKVLIKVL